MGGMNDYAGEFRPDLNWESFSEDMKLRGIELYRKMFLAVDGFWYLAAKEKFGNETAMELDLRVWEKHMRYELKHVTRMFNITGNDVEAFFKATQFMAWSGNIEAELELISKNHGVIRVTKCPTIDALVKEGEGREGSFCRIIEQRMFDFQAAYFSPTMKARPRKIPPETLGCGVYCEWEITC
ncbi:MAG: hypothetical protein KA369_00195 [Spirochaetes bacterium]|nr:hypothetical protein [Spirochaetota bacterium]